MASDHLQPATKLPCIRDLLFFVLQRCCITGAFSYGHSLGEVNPWILIPIETERHYIIDQKEKTPSSQKPWVPLHVDVLQWHHSQGPDHSFNHQQYFNILLHSLFDGHNIFPPKAPQRLPKGSPKSHDHFISVSIVHVALRCSGSSKDIEGGTLTSIHLMQPWTYPHVISVNYTAS